MLVSGKGTRQRVRLRADEWKGGDIGWLIDGDGDGKGTDAALQWLNAGPLMGRAPNLIAQDRQGAPTVSTLEALMLDRVASTTA
jgi:hypothetical protein